MSFITNASIDKVQYANGFNQGMQQSAETFSLMIQLLMLSFAFKVVINFPPIQSRLKDLKGYDILDIAQYSADVLAFFITLMMFWVLLGNNLIG